jgi:uncharacterized RDD family membrane protein YckC
MEASRRPTILTCENCGTEIPDGASFCARCGSPLSVAQIGPVYVPPAPPPAEEIPGLQGFALPQARPTYAVFWLRAVASLIDRFILSLLFGLIASFRPAMFLIFPDPKTQLLPPATLQEFLLSIPRPTSAGFLLLLMITWIYYASFESSSWQATPGKRVLRLYVTDLLGRQITFSRATIHNIGRMISEMTFLVGYIPAGFTEKKQALHDIIARCLVLRRP